jgi:hypothetical protein
VPKSKLFLASAMLLTLAMSACAAAKNTASTTTFGTVAGVAPTLPTLQTTGTTPSQTTPLTPVLSTVQSTTTTSTAPPVSGSSSASSSSSTTTDWEVVGGIFTTKAAAQSQIDKLTAAKFTGFSLKAVGAKTAAVLPGLTKADATAMAAKINTAGVAKATTFHLTSSSTTTTTPSTTATDWEVVGGIFTTKNAAQSQIDKLTAAKFTGFSLKAVGAKTAAVLPGLTQADATAMAAKINKAGVANATTFHLTSSSSTTTATTTTTTIVGTTATNYEVVDGIFTTKTAAQAKIDKLTQAKFTDFTVKPIPGKFAVVKAGLTKAEATDLVTKINAANLGPSRIKAL